MKRNQEMATHEAHSGSIRLYSHWDESASGHVEVSEEAVLTIEDNQVVLTITHETQSFIRGADRKRRVERYGISPGRLTTLLKEHGERLR